MKLAKLLDGVELLSYNLYDYFLIEVGGSMKQVQSKVFTAHVPLPLADKVDQLAARIERSRGWVIKQALSAWIEQEEERYQMTIEALADVDAGRVVDHEAMLAWADSLGTDNPLPLPESGE